MERILGKFETNHRFLLIGRGKKVRDQRLGFNGYPWKCELTRVRRFDFHQFYSVIIFNPQ